ncbi:MAG: cytochrome c [Rhodobacteraceae bacterium]|nr:cytochrome c [Paracoccaceae bacterium]
MPDRRALAPLLLTLALSATAVAQAQAQAQAQGQGQALAGIAPQIPAPRAAELEHVVIQDCGSCHGLTLKGGLGSPLTRDALDGADAETLASIILDGVPDTAMPPWRPLLTEDEALWIAQYLLQGEIEK